MSSTSPDSDQAEFVAGMGIGFGRAAARLDRHQQAGQRRGRRRQQRLGDAFGLTGIDRRLSARTQ